MNFGNPFAGKEALVQALRGAPPAGGGMVARPELSTGGAPQAQTADYSQGMGGIADAMKYKRMMDTLKQQKNLSSGLTASGGYMGDISTGGAGAIT